MTRFSSTFMLGILITGATCRNACADTELSPVVITATRVAESSADLPVAIDRVDRAAIRDGQPQVNLSESLIAVPGASVQSRQNYAQDLQISIRGFGARSSFGVRGVRLYADGIPGTMPDGQGQFSQFDLGSADHIEVLRGPFSALYGNSSGGVISVFTEDGPPGWRVGTTAAYGSFDTQRYALKAAGDDAFNYVADIAHFQTAGYRDHSSAERNNVNVKLTFEPDDASKLTLVANGVETPAVLDPLGLTSAQLAANPRQAGTNAVTYDTRKSLTQTQLGADYRRRLGADDDLSLVTYVGNRNTTQYQAILQSAEVVATSPGGVIDLGRNFWGVDLQWHDHRVIAAMPLRFTAGLSYDDLEEARRGFLNYIGNQLGVEGALRRDEANHVYDVDQYAQVLWDPTARWRILAGVRHSVVDIEDHNHLAAGGPVDSGVNYSAVNPVAGITFRAAPAVNLYASFGKGFETPTLNDLAYRSVNGSIPGLNLGLVPARSNNTEVGVKFGEGSLRADVDAFYVKTENELAVQANSGGRSVYENIGETTRRGMEAALDSDWVGGFSGRLVYTYIRAVVAQAYSTCVGLPCKQVVVPTGNYLPAVPRNALYAGVTWKYAPAGFSVTLETQGRSQIYADDRNSASAGAFWVTNVRAGFQQDGRRWHVTEYLRVDNLADRRYVGSVIVNESNSRFFEPEPGRNSMIMFSAALKSAH
jgi:iron complex outermembrane receptor protein